MVGGVQHGVYWVHLYIDIAAVGAAAGVQGRMYRIDRLYRHLEFNLALPLVVTKLIRVVTYGYFLTHWAACCFWYIAQQVQG